MKREIKFRCWNGEDMISPDGITRDGYAYWKENSIPTGSRDIMQFTGLKDKNGKEIYEGDVVGFVKDKYGDGKHEYWSVEYDDAQARFVCYNQINSTRGFESDIDGEVFVSVFEDYCFICEVIGNIYENKELLEAK
jgi:uncharacterized phage protein (TIGR01671 family)